MALARPLVLVAVAGLVAAAGASAQDADSGPSAIVTPASNALQAIRRAEPRSEVAISVGGAVVDQTGISGLARGAMEVEGSWAPSPTWEVFATMNVLAFRWVQLSRGPVHVEQRQLTLGSLTVGSTWLPVSLPGGRLDAGVFVRVLLPTSQELQGIHVWGGQVGLTFRGVAARWLAWYGGISFPVARVYGNVADTRPGGTATLGLAVVPATWVRFVAQLTGIVNFGKGSDLLSPGVAVRMIHGPFTVELGAVMPLGGPLRTVSTVARASWRL